MAKKKTERHNDKDFGKHTAELKKGRKKGRKKGKRGY